MSPAVKSTFVVAGLLAFCAIPIAGPGMGVAADAVVQFFAGVDDETKVENQKLRIDPAYQKAGMKKALQCCQKACELDWDFMTDRCVMPDRSAVQCFSSCGASLAAK